MKAAPLESAIPAQMGFRERGEENKGKHHAHSFKMNAVQPR